ncbi:hypothetical protein DAMA08_022570 [Martiniozyma asiatica (nom. inval.)]|nr:hypothetical protein DAMA08_022570 [Martiniozyma asiatica]
MPVEMEVEKLNSLTTEYQILHLIYHRNKNQHGSQFWWKHINLLHRHLRRLIQLILDLEEWPNNHKVKFHKITKSFKIENISIDKNHLNLAIEKEIRYIVKKVLPGCYWAFMGIIELGQFINIGFALIGVLGRSWSILSEIVVDLPKPKQEIIHLLEVEKKTNKILDEEFGEELGTVINIEEYIETKTIDSTFYEGAHSDKAASNNSDTKVLTKPVKIKETKIKKEKQKQKQKQKKKKNAKTAMDDIFGF